MTAKHKINQAHVNGALIVAGLVGILAQSYVVFFVALGVFISLDFYSGNIRR